MLVYGVGGNDAIKGSYQGVMASPTANDVISMLVTRLQRGYDDREANDVMENSVRNNKALK